MNNEDINYRDLLAEGLIQTGVPFSRNIMDKLLQYMELVLETNKSMNLTAITEPTDFVIKHYIDSYSVCHSQIFKDAKDIIDVGTGAGFPGIPLAIAFPDKKFVLMDSLNKRIRFLDEICEKLSLKNVACYHARAEELGHSSEHRESYDLCLSRAVAKLSVLSEYCLPFVKPGGSFIAYKAGGENLDEGKHAIKVLGGKLDKIEDFPQLSGSLDIIELDHKLVYVKKVTASPRQYPRKSGLPSKNPL